MKKINLKQLKNNISDINVKKIVISLGGIVYDKEETEKYIIFSSVCHNSSSHKLYWYKDSKQFFCFSRCNRAYSIFDLVMKVKKISFSDSIKYVCTVCNIETHEIERYTEGKKEDYWEESLSKYLKIKRGQKNIKIYDPKILDFFDKIYDYSWIKEGITIETMEKFHIGFYPLKQMITIPVFDKDGNLIGIHGRNLDPEMIENGYKYMPVKMLDNSNYIFSTGQVLYGLNMNQYNIKNQGEVNIFEAPKSVLQMETIAKNNNSVALFGVNLTKYKKKLLLDLGIDVVNICLDKQYHAIFNHVKNEEEKKEYLRWEKTVVKIAGQFKGFCKVNVIYDRSNLLEYKDSPSDKGENIWNILYENKENIFKEGKNANKIYILQDCDVDGLISSVLVYKYLIHLGVKHENIIVLYHKDKRHGLNEDIMKEIKNDCKLLWIPDANPSSQQYVEDLENKNIKIIQTDHHEIPPYDGVFSINNQYSDKVTNKSLSGAGVTYKFIKYCCEQNNDLYHQDLLDLVALSNVADVMDMKNLENRYYNFIGFSNIKNSFLSFLINELSKGVITPTTLAWDVVPKLNAVIRSDNFELKKEIFECFIGTSEEYASVLKKIKREKNNQNKNVQLLLNNCEIKQYKNFILAYVQPSNYTGLLASKIMSKYEKPTFCLYKKNNNYNGSCRSTRDIKTFCNNSNLINFAEGHQKSFGISIPENNIDNFIKYLDTDISYEEEPTEVCCIYNKNNMPDNLFGYWDKYASLWGKNLNEPIFYIENIEISAKDIAVLGRNKSTLKWNINHIDFIYFFADQKLKEKLYNGESDKIILNIVGKLKINDWNNHKIKQVVIDKIEIKKYNKYNSWKELF